MNHNPLEVIRIIDEMGIDYDGSVEAVVVTTTKAIFRVQYLEVQSLIIPYTPIINAP
jgi:hypothetical protein